MHVMQEEDVRGTEELIVVAWGWNDTKLGYS
jgi:hypothetical protein